MSTPADDRPRWFRLGLVAITAAGFFGRLVLALVKGNDDDLFNEGDAFYYNLVADNLAQGHWFIEPLRGRPAADHPPLTVLVLGPTAAFTESILAKRLTMVVIGTAAVVAIALLARAVAGPVAGLVAAALAAINPNFWMNDVVIMSEAVSTLLIALLMMSGVALARSPTVARAAIAGALCGLTVLARAEMGLFLPFMVLPILLTVRGLDGRQRVGRLLLAAALAGAVVAPWAAWNLTRFDEPVVVSTNDGTTLLGANCPEVYDGELVGWWSLRCVIDQTPEGLGDPSVEAREQRRLAFDYIGDNLGQLPKVVLAREGRTFGFWRPSLMVYVNQGEGRPEWASWAGFVTFWVLTPLAIAGGVVLRRRRVTLAPFVAALATVVLVSGLFYGIPRFRLPVDVAVTVLASVAIAELLRRWRGAPTADGAAASTPTT